MSGRGSGTHTWPTTCPVCGGAYTLTNFMKRRRQPTGRGGWQITDTHVMACLRKAGRDPWEEVYSRRVRLGDPQAVRH